MLRDLSGNDRNCRGRHGGRCRLGSIIEMRGCKSAAADRDQQRCKDDGSLAHRGLLSDRSLQQPDGRTSDVLPDVDDVLLVPVTSVLLPQGVPRVEVVSGLVTDVVTDVSGLGVGSATSGLVTGSNVLVVGRPSIGLTPKLPISADPSGIPTRVDG